MLAAMVAMVLAVTGADAPPVARCVHPDVFDLLGEITAVSARRRPASHPWNVHSGPSAPTWACCAAPLTTVPVKIFVHLFLTNRHYLWYRYAH